MRFSTKAFFRALGGLSTAAPLLLASAAQAEQTFPADQIEFFEKNVRPILAESCMDCHGSHRHENGLRLDSRAAVLRGSDYSVVVEAGNPAKSKLIKAIKHEGGVEAMPKKADKLSDAQIATLEKWIAMGAPWPQEAPVAEHKAAWQEHWAFQPVKKPETPATSKLSAQVRNPLDNFVAAKLEKAGLDFAPETDRSALGRRLYINLTGLLPSWEELQTFVNDRSPDATSKLIDNLLNSPRYGERWGRHWLDVVRYSDTKGYLAGGEDVRYPHAYTYRDWVVDAFNSDIPYDQFLIQQLAADKVSGVPTEDKAGNPNLAALGMLTVGDRFQNDRLLQTDDRIDVVTRGMLGLTVTCARCHDHKFDPIPAKDYYALYSVFNSSEQPDELPVIGEVADKEAAASFNKQIADIESQKKALREEIHGEIRKSDRLRTYLEFTNASLTLEGDAFRAAAAKKSLRDRYAAKWRDFFKRYALNDKPHPVMLAWKKFSEVPEAEFSAKAPDILKTLVDPATNINPVFRNELSKRPAPKSFTDIAHLYSDIFLTCISGKEPDNADWQAVRGLLNAETSPMSVPLDNADIFFTRNDQSRMTKLKNDVQKLELTAEGAPQRAMVMVDKPKPADVRVMIRGNPGRSGEPAPRGFLTALGGQKFTEGSGRLELANAIVDPKNPLTARVIVNRIWLEHFGQPLVSQTSDFGVQTPKPEQAELLDYLAASLMEQGWSLKTLHRLILNSRTYQQSTLSTADKDLKDPENLLLSRFQRKRVDYETMRDTLLQVSGDLNEAKMGGRSVPFNAKDVDTRRSVYLLVDRFEQPTVPAMFDFANPDTHSPQRFVTTVPQQTLFLMNSPFMRKRSDMVSQSVPVQGSSFDSESLKALYHRILLREPAPEEVEMAARFVNQATDLQTNFFNWQYGSQNVSKADGKLVLSDFTEFKHFNKRGKGFSWSPGPNIPDAKGDFCFWGSENGHAGSGDKAPVLRWTAPVDGKIRITGALKRQNKPGNGVRGWIISSRTGLIQDKLVTGDSTSEMVATLDVKKGDVLSFAVTSERDTNSDSFTWTPAIYQVLPGLPDELLTNAQRDFCGPGRWPVGRARTQTALSQLAQVLLMSNEFQFVD